MGSTRHDPEFQAVVSSDEISRDSAPGVRGRKRERAQTLTPIDELPGTSRVKERGHHNISRHSTVPSSPPPVEKPTNEDNDEMDIEDAQSSDEEEDSDEDITNKELLARF